MSLDSYLARNDLFCLELFILISSSWFVGALECNLVSWHSISNNPCSCNYNGKHPIKVGFYIILVTDNAWI